MSRSGLWQDQNYVKIWIMAGSELHSILGLLLLTLDWSPLFFLWCFGLSDFVSVIIREQKGSRKRDYLEKCPVQLNKFPRNWFLHDMISWECHDALHVSNNWLHTVQMVKCKGVNFEENSQHATSNIQALISTTQ